MSQDIGESIVLTKEQWSEVIRKAEASTQSEKFMFILRSWANSQTVSWGSINAFSGNIVESDEDRKSGSALIGNITKWVSQITGIQDTKCYCYYWDKNIGSWNIGYYQTFALRQAFGKKGEL